MCEHSGMDNLFLKGTCGCKSSQSKEFEGLCTLSQLFSLFKKMSCYVDHVATLTPKLLSIMKVFRTGSTLCNFASMGMLSKHSHQCLKAVSVVWKEKMEWVCNSEDVRCDYVLWGEEGQPRQRSHPSGLHLRVEVVSGHQDAVQVGYCASFREHNGEFMSYPGFHLILKCCFWRSLRLFLIYTLNSWRLYPF